MSKHFPLWKIRIYTLWKPVFKQNKLCMIKKYLILPPTLFQTIIFEIAYATKQSFQIPIWFILSVILKGIDNRFSFKQTEKDLKF